MERKNNPYQIYTMEAPHMLAKSKIKAYDQSKTILTHTKATVCRNTLCKIKEERVLSNDFEKMCNLPLG